MSQKFLFDAIGTKWEIDIFQRLTALQQKSLELKIKKRIESFDKVYSRFRSDSLVTSIAQKEGNYIFPDDAKELFALYQTLYKITDGKFTPLIGNVLEDAGYDATYSLTAKSLTKPKTWEAVLNYVHPKLITHNPVTLDFGAGGKGYLIDLVGQVLERNKIQNYCIDAGGDILYKSSTQNKMTIGLENPSNTSQIIGKTSILNQSICGSAGNRRAWGDFHHIIDPKMLKPIQSILATWVIAPTTLLADALSTCLFLVPSQDLLKEFEFEYLILFEDNSVEKSTHFDAEIYYKNAI